MIPAGFANVEQQLLIWMLAMIRPGAAFVAAPMFGAGAVPVQLRLVLALAIGIPSAAAANMALPADGIVSVSGLFMIVAEVIAGLALGFVVQIGFAAALIPLVAVGTVVLMPLMAPLLIEGLTISAWALAGIKCKKYTAGTWGPSAAIALVERDGRTWHEESGAD